MYVSPFEAASIGSLSQNIYLFGLDLDGLSMNKPKTERTWIWTFDGLENFRENLFFEKGGLNIFVQNFDLSLDIFVLYQSIIFNSSMIIFTT